VYSLFNKQNIVSENEEAKKQEGSKKSSKHKPAASERTKAPSISIKQNVMNKYRYNYNYWI
jgi:hypothetical protein